MDSFARYVGYRSTYVIWTIAALALLVLSSLPVDPERVPGWEITAFEALNGLPPFLYWPAWAIMQTGNLMAAPAAAAVAAATRRWRLTLALLLTAGLKLLAARVVKDMVVRERPASLLNDVVLRDAPAAGQAYVSGHATIVFAVATVISPYLSGRLRAVLWTVAALAGLARIYVGAHLPLDVLGGAALGWAIGSLVNVVVGVPPHAREARTANGEGSELPSERSAEVRG